MSGCWTGVLMGKLPELVLEKIIKISWTTGQGKEKSLTITVAGTHTIVIKI
jgi:hypothetical protein